MMRAAVAVLVVLALAGCARDPLVYEVTAVQQVEVDVRIANLWRVADDVLVNELDIWRAEGYTCEKRYVETDEIKLGGGAVFIALREIHACWRVDTRTVLQPGGA